ncbi:hypothetical protein [Vibrio diazotrophicus]|uniref:hypothetical protein n=1 Tax=Vibrio diazotrophicus TaxID=685 RepID=UPI0005AAAF80|nr:hypothetical protein [Vibrio diazotrophicus]
MTVLKRRFIRLDEIELCTNFSKGDILEYVEEEKLSYCAVVNLRSMAAAHLAQGKDAVSCVFKYDGVAQLSTSDSRKFARTNQKQMIERVLVLQPEKIAGWAEPEQYFGNISNSRFKIIRNVSKSDKPFVAFTKVEVGQSLNQMGKNFLSKLASISNSDMPVAFDNKSYFQSSSVVIQPQDIRLDLEEIALKLGEPQSVAQSVTDDVNVITHPIDQIVFRVLQQAPSLTADKIWVIIRKDVNQEGGRKYDIDNVIDDITADNLCWFGKGIESENTMTYESFRKSTVYRIRTLIKNKKHNVVSNVVSSVN